MFDVDLLEVLETPTKMRSEISETVEDVDLSGLEFEKEEIPIESEIETISNAPVKTQITDAVAKEGAEMAINSLELLHMITLSPLAKWKMAKKRGGKKAVGKMREIYEKELSGEELNEDEKRLQWKYNAYLKDLEGVDKYVSFTEDERQKLILSMSAYFKKKNISFGGGDSFWFDFATIELMKIAEILMM